MIRKAKKSDVSKIIRLCGQRAKMRSVYPKLPKKRFYTRTSKGYTACLLYTSDAADEL